MSDSLYLNRFFRSIVFILLLTVTACGGGGAGGSGGGDTTAPNAPAITSPADGATVNDDTPTFSGTAEANSSVELFTGGSTSRGTTTADGSGNWSITTGTLTEATYSFTAKATDGASNTSSASTAVSVTIDTTAPSAPAITSPADGATVNDDTPTFSGTAEANSSVELFTGGSTSRGTTTADGSGNWTVTSSSISDATYSFTAKATDSAGNTSAASAAVSITIDAAADSTAPSTPGTPTDSGTYSASTTVTFNWTAATDSESGVASYNLQIGTSAGDNDVLDSNVGSVITYDHSGIDGQTLYARVQAVNGAALSGSWSGNSDGITIDSSAPSTPGTPTDIGAYSTSTTVTFNWTAASDSGSGVASYNLQIGTSAGDNDVLDSNVGSVITYDHSGSDGQTLYARVQAVNGASTTGSWSGNSDGITIDSSAPSTPGTPTDSGTYSTSTTVTFNWTAASDSETGVASYNLQIGTTAGDNDVLDSNVGSVVTYDHSGSDGQTLYARVQAVNGASTTGSWSGNSDGITIDITTPTITFKSPSDSSTGIAIDATVSATFSEAMSTATIIADTTFTIDNSVTGSIGFSGSDTIATYTPSAEFSNATTYTVNLTTGITDPAGIAISATSWNFTTIGKFLTQEAKLMASDAEASDNFGDSVAISGNYAIFGAPIENGNTGAAYIFYWDSSSETWDTGTKITASGGSTGDTFGTSVAISGDYAIVGAPVVSSSTGAAYIFNRTGTNTWDSGTTITASGGSLGDTFGSSVAISGDYAIVGAPGVSSSTGAAYIYYRPSGNSWGSEATVTATGGGATGDTFGSSVAISGDYAIVGAPIVSSSTGAAYIFNRTATNTWDAGITVEASDKQTGDTFGFSVAISGDYAIIGAEKEDGGSGDPASNGGTAYVFYRSSGTTWDTEAILYATDPEVDDQFGHSVSISGDYAIVGAWWEDGGSGDPISKSGAAYTYIRTGTNSWSSIDKISASDAGAIDYFGNSVGITTGFAVVGAPLEDSGGNGAGAVYVFK